MFERCVALYILGGAENLTISANFHSQLLVRPIIKSHSPIFTGLYYVCMEIKPGYCRLLYNVLFC